MSETAAPRRRGRPVFKDAADPEALQRAAQAAAPVVERVEAVAGLDPETSAALYTFLVSLADTKYVLGRRYAEWCTGAPMLESAAAAAAMAQDELGHARSFYPLLRGFPQGSEAPPMEGAGWQHRPTQALACLDRPFATWGDFVAANFLVDSALTTVLEAAAQSSYEPLRQRASKILQEEQVHWVHAQGWTRRLAAADETRPMLADSLQRMWDDAFTWFGRPDDPVLSRLVRAGILAAGPEQLRKRLRARLSAVREAIGLLVELSAGSLPWDRWDARARRLRPVA